MKHTIVMTGASRGIGRVAAEHILRRLPDVHLLVVARGSSGAQLAAELATSGNTVSHVSADLGSLDSVRSAATEIRDRLDRGDLPPLRGFVGNAGIQYTNALTEGPDGFESTFTVNVLANHLFVRLLQDRFAAPARIVITASDTHFGDFKHNLGMVPGPAWKSPDVLARTGAFPKPDTAVAGRTAYSTSKDEQTGRHLPRARVRTPPAGRNRRRRLQPRLRTRHRPRPQRRPRLPVRDAPHPAGDDPHPVRHRPQRRGTPPRRRRPRHDPGADRFLRRPQPCGPLVAGVLRPAARRRTLGCRRTVHRDMSSQG
ncbi:SDR family NAD(P)-dependent oxidoreductase [Streptomyces sp. SID3343]|uniref:SDR family NAD(P)-dependent oxidoreductase n=1 Tax=Streptomyces sp. SID3343 TaxID=2690260 RepID=UPI001F333D8D|nr:SDR family NAD(P)-dependent oxidoreductase [Streptomyces sp. SID3343]